MELAATPLILPALLIKLYPGRDDYEEKFSYAFEEVSCDFMKIDMLMVIYWLKFTFQPIWCKVKYIQLVSTMM